MTRTTPERAPCSPDVRAAPAGGLSIPCVRCGVRRYRYTANLQWNRVSNLERSDTKADSLPLDHRGRRIKGVSSRLEYVEIRMIL
ncbi:hypothetical protein AVEN_116595-1 [Araneus ventricosus]|uniref:Uncharacterized protein n=1 Tax=Araneus ventricosus TaxID=182803 RepID=A0A4Y2DDS1_ARAVE|nr:hypothetical protein AVEN_116595-1 [Araneus ventricosus]